MMFYTPSSWANFVTASAQVEEAAMKPAPTKERVKRVMDEVDVLGLSDEAYWAAVQNMLGKAFGRRRG
jgi:hypothetical protein